MFITGEHDVVVRFQPGGVDAQRKRLAEFCEDLRSFHVIPATNEKSAGHWIQQERPREVNEALESFLSGVGHLFDDTKRPGGSRL